ncbi:MAG TPA: 5-methyltetrahydropteroyltriglutamate--homocysteine S-methyltransferase [Thermoanaerobaculaceae bacterium]|nr:5-methyltetrahydropteroyltriglutamate--homocysteine S-methyltransferase [Thermoanaerobaculaceae bacterium]
MVTAANLGFPRIGPNRELKAALERYWSGNVAADDLLATARAIRRDSWVFQAGGGLDHVPCNDFSLYDHVLDMAVTVGAVPEPYRRIDRAAPGLAVYFAMARGARSEHPASAGAAELPPLRMTKWFDTNYHYLVPEVRAGQEFALESTKPIDEFLEARAGGVRARPVLLGPVSFLLLAEGPTRGRPPLDLLDGLLPVYETLLGRLAAEGAEWVQLDEPCLALDLDPATIRAYEAAYARLARVAPALRRLLATYFGGLGPNLPHVLRLPVDALHLDLVQAPEQLEAALAGAPDTLSLSLGLIDGRNVWRTDLDHALAILERAVARLGPDRVQVAPSCSLLHCPLDLELETELDPEARRWMAFAKQKIREISILVCALRHGREPLEPALAESRQALASRAVSSRRLDRAVQMRAAAVPDLRLRRAASREERHRRQHETLRLPRWPTTTIGSFPQTVEVRRARQRAQAGTWTPAQYDQFVRAEIEASIHFQEELGLDVLVHGEFERSDMVEYFAGELNGFALTRHGWVQSYGSRCVRPPILYGDVSRRGAITVRWAHFAQSLTERPVKGMLTGPVTMLQWSFARDDQPRWLTCRQIALALRDEVADLETAGMRVIQIDEPAIREGLPLRKEDRGEYLSWAVEAFRLVSSGAGSGTQIHTHMCYSDFDDIIGAIAEMDADVLLVEGARSGMRILDVLRRCAYPGDVGPGVYDVHSPRVPSPEEIETLLRQARRGFPADRLWVNPDCGLKTRRWEEVRPALAAMVAAARRLRKERDEPATAPPGSGT